MGFYSELSKFVYIRYHKKENNFLYHWLSFQKDLGNAVGYSKVRLVYILFESGAFAWIAVSHSTKMSSQYGFKRLLNSLFHFLKIMIHLSILTEGMET